MKYLLASLIAAGLIGGVSIAIQSNVEVYKDRGGDNAVDRGAQPMMSEKEAEKRAHWMRHDM
ncbi:MAG: hypothetical protein CL816_05545 [Coxiellaceae bacterium]|nr:hypothetical protein [Coxiellaceae bacterium]